MQLGISINIFYPPMFHNIDA